MSQDEVKEVLRPYFKEVCPNCTSVALTYPLLKMTEGNLPTKVCIVFNTTSELAEGRALLEKKINELHTEPVVIAQSKSNFQMIYIQNDPALMGKFYQDAIDLRKHKLQVWDTAMFTFLMGSHQKDTNSNGNLFLFKDSLFDKNVLRLIFEFGPMKKNTVVPEAKNTSAPPSLSSS